MSMFIIRSALLWRIQHGQQLSVQLGFYLILSQQDGRQKRKSGSEKMEILRQKQVTQRMEENKNKGIHSLPPTNRLIVIASP